MRTDAAGRIDLGALEELLATGVVGTVVLTAGTTGLGAIDPIHEALAFRERYGVRLHVDAAYGGFFTLIADDSPDGVPSAPWRAIAECDSVVIDPHKHGLQPYGCGAVLFRDPTVGRFYQHDSPYTYFTSDEMHLGEISLECSRAGAAAAALWLTFRLLPPTPDGLGAVLRPGRRAALHWAELLATSPQLALYQAPELDIVTYLPRTEPATLSAHRRRLRLDHGPRHGRPAQPGLPGDLRRHRCRAGRAGPPDRGGRTARADPAQRADEAGERAEPAPAARPDRTARRRGLTPGGGYSGQVQPMPTPPAVTSATATWAAWNAFSVRSPVGRCSWSSRDWTKP